MTAAKETNLSHATTSLCAGESETRWQFLWIVAWVSMLRKSGGTFSARYLSSLVSRGMGGGRGGEAVPGRDLSLLDIFQFLKLV